MPAFEEQYEDVLQNIEFAIVSISREKTDLVDSDVEKALNALIVEYQRQQRGDEALVVSMRALPQLVYERAKAMCEWRLGRTKMEFEGADALGINELKPISVEEIIACLKRIRKSVQRWNRTGGQRGYLRFVSNFIV